MLIESPEMEGDPTGNNPSIHRRSIKENGLPRLCSRPLVVWCPHMSAPSLPLLHTGMSLMLYSTICWSRRFFSGDFSCRFLLNLNGTSRTIDGNAISRRDTRGGIRYADNRWN